MSTVETATLKDGRTVKYLSDVIGEGGMKRVHFTADRSSVVCFFKDQAAAGDPQRLARLDAVVGRYNPTLDPKTGGYWKNLFCWPTDIVVRPGLGLLAPAYPANFFFGSGPWRGKEKEGRWFYSPKLSKMLPDAERGTWQSYLAICVLMARAVRRLHQAGLAHSDLSCKNVLIDPSAGRCAVIDIDGLVVPGLYPPDVAGTPGYIAPEVLATMSLDPKDPNRRHPSARTDQHSLAVLIYETLLGRHPLRGPKVNSAAGAEEDELLSMGAKALWVEHPADRSNRPADLTVPATSLGAGVAGLFETAFVKGLHDPAKRPTALEWERALIKTWDALLPCAGAGCTRKWFVFPETGGACPFCGTRPRGPVPVLKLHKEGPPGEWRQDGYVAVYDRLVLFKWHALANVFPGEEADRTPQAMCAFYNGQWILINKALPSLTSPAGNPVAVEQAVALKPGERIRLSAEPQGRIAEVTFMNS